MNKTAIKNFAIWARNKLIADISYRAGLMGITADGIHTALPQSTGQTEFYDIGTAEPYAITGEAIRQRKHLVELIQRKEKDTDYKTAYKYIIEEVAYTWFNRLIAVRFMEVNDYLPSHIRVLSSDTGKMEPDLVTTPFDLELDFTRDEQQTILELKNVNKLDEVFRLLFIKQCNALNEILPALFEKTHDYTELLLNLSVIDQDGIVYHLVHDIPEEDFNVERGGQVEIIGWLYQYYNTEPKNEAFAKKGKITKEEVPAVTQLFTPDWIVRYMVENSLGRLWVEGHPNDDLKSGWKYYLEEAEQEPEVQTQLAEIRAEYAKLNPEDIRVIDPCMGSGHILVYAFDVLMQIYESAGYSQRDAARSILENNLYGLDIDDRAFQMAYFAIMMKARQYNRRILNGEYRPNVYSIQESNGIDRNQLKYFGAGLNELEKNNAITQMNGLLDTFKDAKEYGSILSVEQYDWDLLDRFVSNIEVIGQMSMYTVGLDDTAEELKQLIAQGKALAQKYHVTTTNPPYMAISSGTGRLNEYVKNYYPDSKSDLFAVFIEKCKSLTFNQGFDALITMHSWMFLSSFEKLRLKIKNTDIINMAHLGARAFEEIGGEVVQTTAFVYRNTSFSGWKCTFVRIVDAKSQLEKERIFLSGTQRYLFKQSNFDKIPGTIFGYWISDKTISAFENAEDFMSKYAEAEGKNVTTDNARFIRCFWETSSEDTGTLSMGKKWLLCAMGGTYRKWFGNVQNVIDWSSKARIFYKEAPAGRIIRQEFWNLPGVTWGKIGTGDANFRLLPSEYMYQETAILQKKMEDSLFSLALLNAATSTYFLKVISPTMNFQQQDINSIPIPKVGSEDKARIIEITKKLIHSSMDDWNSFETAWGYESHPLVKIGLRYCRLNDNNTTIEESFRAWSDECEGHFEQLKANEEELNRIFIDIYGLQDELTPEVEDKAVTIRCADLQRDIKSLLSYAVGCMFGRYSLGTTGLAYAGGDWNEQKYGQFKPDADNVIPITDEEYLEDDIVSRLCDFLKVAFGEQTLEQNLDYIAKALDNKGDSSREIIRNYFLNDFFKDHCQTYSVTGSGKRPIYWLFDSGKQNGFKALIYLHRYNADTIGNLRIDYLHRMQRVYESEISRMQDMIDHSTNAREVAQSTKRREKLQKQLKECREYDEKLAHLALSRIELDLDDGVKVNYRKLQIANDGKFYEVLADSKNIMANDKLWKQYVETWKK